MTGDNSTRLNKYLALQLGISRREADEYIERGDVVVNGQVAALGARVQPDDRIEVDHRPIDTTPTDKQYLLLNKPVGYLCSRKSQGAPTIYELLPAKYHTLKPVGRLDKDSSGLVMLTNDGDFAYQMTHPKFVKTKVYKISLDHDLEPLHQQMIADIGVNLPDGHSQLGLTRLSDTNRREWQVTMHEGRNRQIRRTFAALGYTVVKLHRTDIGPYSLGDITRGQHKLINIQ